MKRKSETQKLSVYKAGLIIVAYRSLTSTADME